MLERCKMKILFVSNLYPPHFIGGYEIACKDTVDILNKAGHECFVLTSVFTTDRTEIEDKKVFKSLELHDSWDIGKGKLSFKETKQHNKAKMIDLTNELNPDIVYFWNIYGLSLSPVEVCVENNIPYVIHLMDLSIYGYQKNIRRTFSRLLGRHDIECVDINKYFPNVISISKYVRDNLKMLGKSLNQVIYPYLDHSNNINKKINYSRDNNMFKSVFIGQIEEHKGIELLCQAIEKINISTGFKIHLDIYGRSVSGLDKELEKNYENYITIFRDKNRDEILENLYLYDVGFFPSIWEEPFGIAQIELMSIGLPILASARGGSKEALTDNNSIKFINNDLEDLVEKLAFLLENYKDIAPNIGENAIEYIEKNFNKDIYIESIQKVLYNVSDKS